MSETSESIVYQLKVVLLGISPKIWRRLLECGDSTITDLRYIIQIAMRWSGDHLNRFRIHGKQYGVYRLGGLTYSDDPDGVRLRDFRFRINECFRYEYDFTAGWRHQIRVEAILAPEPQRRYPVCIDGRRSCPPEDCGGPWAFMALRLQYSMGHILMRLAEIAKEGSMTITPELLRELSPYRTAHIGRFGDYELRDRNVANLEYDFKLLESTDGAAVM